MSVPRIPVLLHALCVAVISVGCAGKAHEPIESVSETAEAPPSAEPPSTGEGDRRLAGLSEEDRRFLGLDDPAETDGNGAPESLDGAAARRVVEGPRSGEGQGPAMSVELGEFDISVLGKAKRPEEGEILISEIAGFPPDFEGHTPEEAAAIAAIKAAGGSVRYRSSTFGEPDEGIVVKLGCTSADADVLHAAKISGFQHLDLTSCYRLTDVAMETIGQLTQLQTLYLGHTDFTDIGFAHLARLDNLEYLSLWDTCITDQGMKSLGQLTKLESLGLSWTRVGDAGLVYLSNLTNLRELGLSQTPMTDAGLAHLQHLTKLEDLTLNGTGITGRGLQHLRGLAALKELNLERTLVDDRGLENLRGLAGLQSLTLNETRVSDAGIMKLAGLAQLKKLRVKDTPVTQSGHDALKAKLPATRIFFGETEWYPNKVLAKKIGYHPDEEESVRRLKQLHAEVTIGEDRRVWWVQAIATRFSDEDVELFRPLKKLNRIELSNCRRFTDTGLEALKDFPSLRQVFVQQSGVTREGVDRIQLLMPDTEFFQ